MSKGTKEKQIDAYQIITDRIIAQMEKGIIPWRKPWVDREPPKNLITGKPYRGMNTLLLGSAGYKRNLFLSFKQAKELGATVRKGEKSLPVVYWKMIEQEDPVTKEKKRRGFIRYYNVFNVEQCEGIPEHRIPVAEEREHTPIQECETIVKDMPNPPAIMHGGDRACYWPSNDSIEMPMPEYFRTEEEYYATLFHELVHSSGHESRLNRKELVARVPFGSEEYAIEELTAEIGATFLRSKTGISSEIENNAAYVQSWLTRLKNDKKFIVHASTQAQKAVDHIMNVREIEKEIESMMPEVAGSEQELNELRSKKDISITR